MNSEIGFHALVAVLLLIVILFLVLLVICSRFCSCWSSSEIVQILIGLRLRYLRRLLKWLSEHKIVVSVSLQSVEMSAHHHVHDLFEVLNFSGLFVRVVNNVLNWEFAFLNIISTEVLPHFKTHYFGIRQHWFLLLLTIKVHFFCVKLACLGWHIPKLWTLWFFFSLLILLCLLLFQIC